MKIAFDHRAKGFLNSLNDHDKSKVFEYLALFDEYGYHLDRRYLKKVTKAIWELRPGGVRLFIIMMNGHSVLIHAMHKKSQKITNDTMKLIGKRMKEYL